MFTESRIDSAVVTEVGRRRSVFPVLCTVSIPVQQV